MNTLFVMTDLGRVRVVRKDGDLDDPTARLHLVEVPTAFLEDPLGPISEEVTDQAGRFGRSASAGEAGGMSYGEEHEAQSERERRSIVKIASHVDQVLAQAGYPPFHLAAPKSVLKRLEAKLGPKTRQMIRDTIPADLTKVPLSELESRFLK